MNNWDYARQGIGFGHVCPSPPPLKKQIQSRIFELEQILARVPEYQKELEALNKALLALA